MTNIAWYLRRIGAMEAKEIVRRFGDRTRQEYWRWRYYLPGSAPRARAMGSLGPTRELFRALDRGAPPEAAARLMRIADALIEGKWRVFDNAREDLASSVDWHFDPKNGAPVCQTAYSFDLRINGEGLPFDTKYVWELSRHHQTTVLAMAYRLTRKAVYAQAAVAQIESWCKANPFLSGIHWTSAIELGLRLTSFVWTHRLLEGWDGRESAFNHNPLFRARLYQHQWLLRRRMSFGSSANNHLLSEATGLFVAASAMPWFAESESWREMAQEVLEREFACQIFPSGMSRELASDYHGANLETFFVAALESELVKKPFSAEFWEIGRRMTDIVADLADCRGHPPRQGDGDDASNLLLDNPAYDRWGDLLDLGRAVFGGAPWWPAPRAMSLRAWLFSELFAQTGVIGKYRSSAVLKSVAADSGVVVLRSRHPQLGEIYCAFDAGPFGFRPLAAHAHADALAIELRVDGKCILVDPGTFSYTAAPRWRDYFRSTAAHNTLELCGRSQSVPGGPFLWVRSTDARLLSVSGLDEGAKTGFAEGEHEGYRDVAGTSHRRSLKLERLHHRLTVEDMIAPSIRAPCRLNYHLHPGIDCTLNGNRAVLEWSDRGTCRQIDVLLPASMDWRAIRACDDPISGWYSPSYDCRVGTTTLVGTLLAKGPTTLTTVFDFSPFPTGYARRQVGGSGI